MYQEILLTVESKIATITFNRPEVSNAFAKDSYIEIKQAIDECENSDDVNVIILTGKGRHFSAGGDINRFKTLIDNHQTLDANNIKNAGNMTITTKRCSKPTIAMINGAAAGAGCALALACDFRIMEPKSRLAMAFINLALSGDSCGLYYLEKLVGIAKATELMMIGHPINGIEAKKIGLATFLSDDGSLEETTLKFAAEMAQKPLFAIKQQKALINESFYSDLDDYMQQEAIYMENCSQTEDFSEAVNAFLEKRKPQFKGY